MAGSNPLVPRVPRGHAEGPRRALHRREWLRSRAWKSRPGQNRGGQPVLCPRERYYLVLQGAGCQHNPADCRRRPVQACPWAGTCLRLTTSKPPAPQQCVLQEVRAPLLLEPAQGLGTRGEGRQVLLGWRPSHLQDPSCCAGCLPDCVPKPSGDRASREARRRGCSGKRSFGGAKVTHAALASATARRGPVLPAARLPPPPPRGGTTGPTDHAISGDPSPASGTPQGSSGPRTQPQGEDPSPRKATRRSGRGEAGCRVREQAGRAPGSAPPGGPRDCRWPRAGL